MDHESRYREQNEPASTDMKTAKLLTSTTVTQQLYILCSYRLC